MRSTVSPLGGGDVLDVRRMIVPPTTENLRRAAELLARGELVAVPTETVYGLAGDAFNAAAGARTFETKERPTVDPLGVHVAPIADGADAIGAPAPRGGIDPAAPRRGPAAPGR